MNMLKRLLRTTKRYLILRNRLMKLRLRLNSMFNTEIERPMVNKHVNRGNMIRLRIKLRKKSSY